MADLQSRLEQVKRDKQLLEDEQVRIEKEISDKKFPMVRIGQIYSFPASRFRCDKMVACVNSGGYGLTGIDKHYVGCYHSRDGIMTKEDMREFLIKEGAKYLGTFHEIYERKN